MLMTGIGDTALARTRLGLKVDAVRFGTCLLASRAWSVVAAPRLVGFAWQACCCCSGAQGHSPCLEEQGIIIRTCTARMHFHAYAPCGK